MGQPVVCVLKKNRSVHLCKRCFGSFYTILCCFCLIQHLKVLVFFNEVQLFAFVCVLFMSCNFRATTFCLDQKTHQWSTCMAVTAPEVFSSFLQPTLQQRRTNIITLNPTDLNSSIFCGADWIRMSLAEIKTRLPLRLAVPKSSAPATANPPVRHSGTISTHHSHANV